MPYAPEHKLETRQRIVDSARRLFNRRGFAEVSIDEIMAGAGLTRGGFYHHFKTKDELYAEAVTRIMQCDPTKRWPEVQVNFQSSPETLAGQIINAYLSRQHLSDPDSHCPLIALPSDVARSTPRVREAFEKVFLGMTTIFERGLSGPPNKRQRALAIASLCVGAMALARAIEDPDLAEEIRESARSLAHDVGDWENFADTDMQASA